MKNKETIITKLPLTEEQIEKYYTTIQQYFFKIKVSESTSLTPKQFINYIANANLKCDLILDNADEKFVTNIIKEYLTTNRQVSIPIINKIIINALEDIIMKTKNPINKEFVLENKELLIETINVLNNLKFAVEIMINGEEYDNEILNLQIKENNIIGTNIISLRNEEAFWNLYMLLEFTKNKKIEYYKDFVEPSIKGYSMLYFIVNEKNPIGIAVRSNKK